MKVEPKGFHKNVSNVIDLYINKEKEGGPYRYFRQ